MIKLTFKRDPLNVALSLAIISLLNACGGGLEEPAQSTLTPTQAQNSESSSRHTSVVDSLEPESASMAASTQFLFFRKGALAAPQTHALGQGSASSESTRAKIGGTSSGLGTTFDFLSSQIASLSAKVGFNSGARDARLKMPEPTLVASPVVVSPIALAPTPVPTPAPTPPLAVVPVSLMPTINLATISPLIAIGSATVNIAVTSEIAPASAVGAFRTVCGFSHMAFDDPIVFPGQAGRSHLHTFFGNNGTNAASTADLLRTTGNSTCRGGIANRSAYWVSSMIDTKDGTAIVPKDIGVYYKSGYTYDATLIQLIPERLRMIAGNPDARAARGPADGFSFRFKCVGGNNSSSGDSIPNCDVGAEIWQEIFFPQCWDGVNLDSPDHKSHMSYFVQAGSPPYATACPITHPVVLPEITFNVVYSVKEQDAPLRWRLASDNYSTTLPGGFSSHADWFNGWDKNVSDAFVNNCIRAKKDCHSHLLGDGRTIF